MYVMNLLILACALKLVYLMVIMLWKLNEGTMEREGMRDCA